MLNGLQNLVIVSHAVHYSWDGLLFAYGPYTREIDLWADLFPRVVIVAPLRDERPPSDCLAFTRSNISVFSTKETGGTTCRAKLRQLASLPALTFSLCRAMRQGDAIHVRCPGNLGLLGTVLAPLFSRRLVAKYAGQWNGYPGEPATVKLQRALLRSWWWRGPVTVYGRWPDQPSKVVPFFTSILTDAQVNRARRAAGRERCGETLRVLFVGRLSASKNVDTLIEAAGLLKSRGVRTSLAVLGDGPERQKLEARSAALNLSDEVKFTGAMPFEKVLEFYEWADVLVLTSETEGWPKAIAEAMAFGLVCIGSDRGFIPQMLGENRGVVIPPRDIPALACELEKIATDARSFHHTRRTAAAWAQAHSLESLREALRDLLSRNWGVVLRTPTCSIEHQQEEVRA